MWDLTDKYITGIYMGLFPVSGLVESSRVKYGGTVCHTIVLDEPIKVYGAVRDRVIIDHHEVFMIYDNPREALV